MTGEQLSKDEVDVTYTAADLRSLYRVCSRCRRRLIWISAIPVGFLLLDFLDGVRGVHLVYAALPYILASIVILLTFYFLVPLGQIRARRKAGWSVPIKIQLTDDGVSISHPSQTAQYHWSGIKDVVLSEERLFLFTTPACAIILPRRVFSNDEHFTRWGEFARSTWSDANRNEGAQ